MNELVKILELTNKIVNESPFYNDYHSGSTPCFFCDEEEPSHSGDCDWLALRDLLNRIDNNEIEKAIKVIGEAIKIYEAALG